MCFPEEEDWRRLPAKDAGVDDDAMEKKKKATQFPDFELSFLELFQDTETAPTGPARNPSLGGRHGG